MPHSQLDRLKTDLMELENYAAKLLKKGKTDEAKNIMKKRDFLYEHLAGTGIQLSN